MATKKLHICLLETRKKGKKKEKEKKEKWSADRHRADVDGLARTWSRLDLAGLPRRSPSPGARWSYMEGRRRLLSAAASVPRKDQSARSTPTPWPETPPNPAPLRTPSQRKEGRKVKGTRGKRKEEGEGQWENFYDFSIILRVSILGSFTWRLQRNLQLVTVRCAL